MFAKHRLLYSRLIGVIIAAYVLLVAPVSFLPHWGDEIGELIGFVMLTTAAFGRLWCLIFIAGKKNEVLLDIGPYSVVRNPLYVFSFIGGVGFGLAVESPWLAVIIGIFFIVGYQWTVRYEEKQLTDIFGPAYEQYCQKTPRWIPDFRLYQEPQTLTIHPGRILRGIFDAMWFLWAFLLWEVIELCHATGVWHVLR